MMQVSEGLSVTIFPDAKHEFLIPTKDVANCYDINANTLRSHKSLNKDELIEGKHFIDAVEIFDGMGVRRKTTMWTKQGVIRLGFYVKSERAKLFRDWVERLVVNFIEKKLPELPETPKRKHNRLTPERMIAIMSKLCQVKDDALRIELAELITGHES